MTRRRAAMRLDPEAVRRTRECLGEAVATLLPPRPSRVSLENYERVEVGMGRAQAEGVLGPEGDYRNGPMQRGPHGLVAQEGYREVLSACCGTELDAVLRWAGDEGDIWLGLAYDGRVLFKVFLQTQPVGGPAETRPGPGEGEPAQ
jgi:hypothetical protein